MKKNFLLVIIIVLLVNSIFATINYYYIVPNYIINREKKEFNQYKQYGYNIENKITKQTINKVLNESSKTHQINIELKNDKNTVIYETQEVKLKYTYNKIIKINNESYLLSITDNNLVNYKDILKGIIIIQAVIFILVITTISYFVSRKILSPVELIMKDMDNYKEGTVPKKIKIRNKIDKLQNKFVDLVNILEKEKDNDNNIIASISHDIKTPLTSIIGYTYLLKTTKVNEKKEESYLDKIYIKALHIQELTEKFDTYLDFDLKEKLILKEIKVSKLLTIIEEEYKEELKQKNIELKINNIIEEKVTLDLVEIKRVFSNIINNSIRHFQNLNPIITIETKRINNQIEFTIIDNGIGIEEDQVDKIFEPLYTTDKSRKIAGLGLSICKRIIKSHGGDIRAISIPGEGLTIKFSLNIAINKS